VVEAVHANYHNIITLYSNTELVPISFTCNFLPLPNNNLFMNTEQQ